MYFELSLGEAIDKLNILEIKEKKIKDPERLSEVQKEIKALNCLDNRKTRDYYKILTYINEQIWELTDEIKEPGVPDDIYIKLSKQIFSLNEKRFRIKKIFNEFSNLKEQKSYNSTFCKVEINDNIHEIIPEILWLSIEYDYVIFNKNLKEIFNTSNFIHIDESICYSTEDFNWEFYVSFNKDLPKADINTHQAAWDHWISYGRNEERICNGISKKFENPESTLINIGDIKLSDELKKIFSLNPINYCSGGLLGDFVHNLSVINEMYIKTCRKGNLYLQNGNGPGDYIHGHEFRLGCTDTFNDVYPVISQQNYINKFTIHQGEKININLNTWRLAPISNNWYTNFKKYFGVEWGKHKWLTVPIESKWNDRVLINTTDYGFPYDFMQGHVLSEQGISKRLDFNQLLDIYGNSLIFVAMDEKYYFNFIQRTGISSIPFYKMNSFTEMCIILNSCKKIYGSFSSPLAIAGALHKERFPPLI